MCICICISAAHEHSFHYIRDTESYNNCIDTVQNDLLVNIYEILKDILFRFLLIYNN